MLLTRDHVATANDTEYDYVTVNEWRPPGITDDAQLKVRSLSARHRSQVEGEFAKIYQSNKGYDRIGQTNLQIVVWGCVNEDGTPVFSEKDDLRMLADKSSAPVNRLAEKIREMSGMKQGADEEDEEAFEPAQDSDSPIG